VAQIVHVGLAGLDTERLNALVHLFSSLAGLVPEKKARNNSGRDLS
jgi:hypothetical protein